MIQIDEHIFQMGWINHHLDLTKLTGGPENPLVSQFFKWVVQSPTTIKLKAQSLEPPDFGFKF